MPETDNFSIGITGHRFLPIESISSLTTKVQEFLTEKTNQHGEEKVTVLSSLAEGADTLCAKLALDAGIRLVVPLPMTALEYREDFKRTAVSKLDCLLSLAEQVFVVRTEDSAPQNPCRGFYYRQAAIYIVKHCDILLAVWDGEERDTRDGAGTWETIKLAREFGKHIHIIDLADVVDGTPRTSHHVTKE